MRSSTSEVDRPKPQEHVKPLFLAIVHNGSSRIPRGMGAVLIFCALSGQSSILAAGAGTSAGRRDLADAQPAAAKGPEPWPATPGQLGLTVGAPISRVNFVHGELTVDFRYGYKLWWLVPYISGGFRQTRLDPLDWPWEARNRKLRAWHATMGLRLELPASQKLFPFIGVAAERSTWAYTEDSTGYCTEPFYPADWRCYRAMDWKPGYAFKPQIGLVYKPEPSLGLEFWLEYVHVMAPEMFHRSIGFFQPAIGLAWHH